VNSPLRGTRAGVRGNEMDLSGSYRWHEAREASFGAGALDLNDGNLRRWLQLGVSQRIVNLPRHKLLATARGYASRNRSSDESYYNPAADRELSLGLMHEWRVLQIDQRGLTQRIGVEAGDYHQEDFGHGAVWTAFAEHEWLLGQRGRLRYGLKRGGRVYDGDREHPTSAFVSLEWRP
jgi:hypothetical protein